MIARYLRVLLLVNVESMLILCFEFIRDKDCLYNVSGVSHSFSESARVDFYIPPKWFDKEEYLLLQLSSSQLVLRHPLSVERNPSEINLPLDQLKVGWNIIYLDMEDDFQVLVKSFKGNSTKILTNFSIEISDDLTLFVKGMNSLIDCTRRFRYYFIPSNSRVEIPKILYGFIIYEGAFGRKLNFLRAFSTEGAFYFELITSGQRRRICKDFPTVVPNAYNVLLIERCRRPVTRFFGNVPYNVLVDLDNFDPEDILYVDNSSFVEITVRNFGNISFYVAAILPFDIPRNGSISLLKGKAEHTSIWIRISVGIVVGVVAVVLLILVCAYTNGCRNIKLIRRVPTLPNEDFFPFSDSSHGYVEGQPGTVVQNTSHFRPKVPDATYPLSRTEEVGAATFHLNHEIPSIPSVFLNQPPEEDLYEQYHYYEKYYSQKDEEAKPGNETEFADMSEGGDKKNEVTNGVNGVNEGNGMKSEGGDKNIE